MLQLWKRLNAGQKGRPVETPAPTHNYIVHNFHNRRDADRSIRGLEATARTARQEPSRNTSGPSRCSPNCTATCRWCRLRAATLASSERLYRRYQGRRNGKLLNASLPELAEWGREHPDVPKITAGTVNKQLTAVQAIANWAHDNGMIPDDVQWADPFRRMRLGDDEMVGGGGPFELSDFW